MFYNKPQKTPPRRFMYYSFLVLAWMSLIIGAINLILVIAGKQFAYTKLLWFFWAGLFFALAPIVKKKRKKKPINKNQNSNY